MKQLFAMLFAVSLALVSLHASAAPVNINTADAKAIDAALIGVGAQTAKAIVDYRAKHGAFKSVDELAKVKGIGPKLIEKNKGNILLK